MSYGRWVGPWERITHALRERVRAIQAVDDRALKSVPAAARSRPPPSLACHGDRGGLAGRSKGYDLGALEACEPRPQRAATGARGPTSTAAARRQRTPFLGACGPD